MGIVHDPGEIERLARQRERENWEFRAWIKGRGPDDNMLNELVHELTDRVWAEIDCTQCANCCRVTSTVVVPDEFMPLSRALGLSIEEFKANILRFDSRDKCWELPEPCPLLVGNLCRVYDDRPQQCRDYPNLHHDLRSHSIARFANAEICPIVFNVIESLKLELRWPGLRRWRGRSRRRR